MTMTYQVVGQKMSTDKKSRERQFLDEIAEKYPDFPQGSIVDYERPDFLVQHESFTTGIEIVDYIRGQNNDGASNRRNEVLWQRIADSARAKFVSSHTVPLLVHFHWNPHRYPNQLEVGPLAGAASSIVANHIPQMLFETIRIGDTELENTALEEYLHSIHVMRVRDDTQSLWSFVGAGFVEVQRDELRDLISSKEAKVQDYLQECDAVWLIIVADGRNISSSAELVDETMRYPFGSLFERILFYNRIKKQIITLVVS